MSCSASRTNAASTLSELRALVSRKGMLSSLASAAPSGSVTTRSVLSDLLPIKILHVSGAAYFSTSLSHSLTWSKDSRCVTS